MIMTGRVNGAKAVQETNAAHVLIIRGPALVAQDTQHVDALRRHCQPYIIRVVRR
jgi:hypothetical protein